MDLQRVLKVCKTLVLQAGSAIMEVYAGDVAVSYKEDASPLTEADQRANTVIMNGLREAFPCCPILSEESEDNQARLHSEWCFIVDPLDGTKEFLNKNGEFTVNIALAYRQRVVVGVIYAPALKQLYYAVKGQGAWLEKDGLPTKLKVSDKTGEDIRLVMSRSHASEQEERLIRENSIRHVRKSGSSLKGCLIAQGEAEVYYRFGPTMEWDIAAMQCIVEEAGGIMQWLDGGEIFYNREDVRNGSFVAVNNYQNVLKV